MRNAFTISVFLLFQNLFGQDIALSEKSHISVITCAPSQDELYSAFGHSAIRVYDPELNIDHAFNYGVFDFDQPNFYLNFTRGHLLYKLAVQPYPRFREIYLYYGRWVHEQVLDLNQEQKQKVFDYLQWNARPENQNYLYDYFYNNCATKIRDVFKEVLKEEIEFDGSFVTTDYTIRELTDIYLKEQPWGDLGIDICLGLPMDKKASPYEYMFLPDYVESSFNHASISNGEKKSAVKNVVISNPSYNPTPENSWPHPWILFGTVLVFIAVVTARDFKVKRVSKWLDFILLFLTGAIGCLLFVLWVATDHKAAANNFNLLWAMPLNLPFAFLIFKKRKLNARYFGILTGITLVTLLLWPILPQKLNVFLLPIVVGLVMRYFTNYWFSRKITYG
ncbi:MAG TPA: DUF4105 domain-containing protein [Cyclobacteriaceae bacterium]|nr:DUF4105 domain-containing protein [Cyclobacteriaceae bacterium]